MTKDNLDSLTATLGGGLSRFGLQRSQVDGDGLMAFMDQRTSVMIELRDANIDTSALERAMRENRLFADYLDESPEYNVDARPANFNRSTYGNGARLVSGDWDVHDKQTLDPKIFRLFTNNSSSKDQLRRESQSNKRLIQVPTHLKSSPHHPRNLSSWK